MITEENLKKSRIRYNYWNIICGGCHIEYNVLMDQDEIDYLVSISKDMVIYFKVKHYTQDEYTENQLFRCPGCIKKLLQMQNPEGYKDKKDTVLKIYKDLSKEKYNAMLESQHNSCAICKRLFSYDLKPVIDHNHATENVRGILCGACNGGLGLFKDNKILLLSAISYLEVEPPNDTSIISKPIL
jgi:protein-arginine kinase activator protein McsA